ncbi:hypothetical protein [Chondromyces apiculatus]|uniref:Uncharacterized protein n=1 Tax=Chondromyces apiculatus DSM 436 TaxID=1192034 RepID=A0A017T7W2_9BACT|nr:hypothetical protein [Chondromyces apiculatus]EYF05334.1 Hypothetical protein CAP_3251 [Chondromyces apiculatus DSM 436]
MRTTLLVKPYKGPLAFDFQSLEGTLVDLPDRKTRGLRREKEGWEQVAQELRARLPVHAGALRLAHDVDAQLADLSERLDQVRTCKKVVDELARVAAATEALLEDQREGMVTLVVEAVRKAAKRTDPMLLTAFEQTIHYRGQLGKRAVMTRRANEEAAAKAAAAAMVAVAAVEAGGAEQAAADQAAADQAAADQAGAQGEGAASLQA